MASGFTTFPGLIRLLLTATLSLFFTMLFWQWLEEEEEEEESRGVLLPTTIAVIILGGGGGGGGGAMGGLSTKNGEDAPSS